ncbi:hypothetical protein [Lewinella cohaerens]|uniref:hypothetical protein n=1 Tax=Lewinella cohaerens TaxID=70995 RepID=UPI000379FAB5|nr:hypothetical protein [Lewinella cohaerens]
MKASRKTWEEQKVEFVQGLLFCIVLFLLSFIIPSKVSPMGLNSLSDKKLHSFEYLEKKGKKRSHLISIKLDGDDREFEISSIGYQEFNHDQFKEEIKVGDVVDLEYSKSFLGSYEIHVLRKNNKDYCNLEKVEEHKNKNRLWLRFLSAYGFLICLLPLSFEEKPNIPFKGLLIVGLIVIFVLLSMFVGTEYITLRSFR